MSLFTLTDLINGLTGASADSSWTSKIKQAKFRGIPFAVATGDIAVGRRVAVHEYPYRETAWIEDLGKAIRKITLQGFLIQDSLVYGGGDVFAQRDKLIAACEQNGSGVLLHPTLGALTVSIPAGGLKLKESKESGRVFEFSLTCYESGLKQFAITGFSSGLSATVKTSWLATISAAAAKFISTVSGILRSARQAIKTLKSTEAFWINMVKQVSNEATNFKNVVSSSFGSSKYGRYNTGSIGGKVAGGTGVTTTGSDTTDYDTMVSILLATAIAKRSALDTAITDLNNVTTVSDWASSVQSVVASILDSAAGAENITNTLSSVANFSDSTCRTGASAEIANAAAIYLNIVTASAMAYSAAQVKPDSYDAAVNTLSKTLDVLDAAALAAADSGQDDVTANMMQLRKSLVDYFYENGASLKKLATVTYNQSLPALTIANKLYQDASRAESLIKQVDPIHPAFMPISFRALAS